MVAQDFPWPVTLGSHLRLAQVIEALSDLGETDLFAFVPARRQSPCVLPPALAHLRLQTVVRPPLTWSPGRRLRWLASSGLPLELAMEDSARPRQCFASWRAESYDVAWFSKATTYELLGRPRLGPTIVDLDDLEDEKIRSRLAALGADAGPGLLPRTRRLVAEAQATLNARRWSRFQTSVAADVDRVVLCSELDARRSALPNVTVVANGYTAPSRPLGHDVVGSPGDVAVGGILLLSAQR